jgi:dephospho-CoA kinase
MNTSPKVIIGIAGTLSSGKDTLANYLEKERGFLHKSTSDMLRAEKKRIYGDSEEALLKRADPFANNLRREKGPGILVQLAFEEFIATSSDKLVISGIRSIGEVEKLHEVGGKLVFVDANTELRFKRATSRNRDKQDVQTLDDFLKQEATESIGIDPTDKTIQNLPAMKELADYVFYNDNDLDNFLREVSEQIPELNE